MFLPDNYHKTELVIKNSRFIAELHPLQETGENDIQAKARQKLKELKTEYRTASHVCHAFVLGRTGGILGCSDDGEPPGTAGRPMLEVLKGSQLTNTMVTVARWFGGTLLGTGGLVKAYSDAVKAVVALTKACPVTDKTSFTFSAGYDAYNQIKHIFKQYSAVIISETFAASVTVHAEIPTEEYPALCNAICEASNGKVTCTPSA